MRKKDPTFAVQQSCGVSEGEAAADQASAESVAAYVEEMALQLAAMARQARLDRLSFLLAMAATEAQLARQVRR